MPRKGETRARQPIGDLHDPDSLYRYLLRYLEYRRERNYSAASIGIAEERLRLFIGWCDSRGLNRPQELTRPILEGYQRYLYLLRKQNGEPLSVRSQHSRLVSVRAWGKWLARQGHILYNPAADLELPRLGRFLPRHVLNVREVEWILAIPDTNTCVGLRDRAILETLYSTGIRRLELIGLSQADLDREREVLLVRQGKGRKDRFVPIGTRALAWIERYREQARPQLSTGADDHTLFLSQNGLAFCPNRLTQLVRDYVRGAKLNKHGSCHLFRHTMATLMLENGADIRVIQALLGHVLLNTTQIYTQVSIKLLKAVHTATHPGKPIQRRHGGDSNDSADLAELLQQLEQEAEEEQRDE